MRMTNKRTSSIEDLPEALLGEIIKRLPTTSDLNSISLVSKQFYIDDSGLCFLACFKKLMSLRLNTVPRMTASGLLSVAVGCKSLSALRLIRCKNVRSVEWLEHLGKIGSLEELVVMKCKRIGQFDLLSFGSEWMKLQRFEFQSLYMPNRFSDQDASYVAGNLSRYGICCDCLKDLTLVRITTVAEIGLCSLLSKCKALENLCLNYVFGLHDNDMITLAHNSRNLRSISLLLMPQHCEGYVYRTSLTDDSLKALSLWCPTLQSVELSFCGCEPDYPEIGFSQEGLVKLIQSCPIRDLTLREANIFDDEGMRALSDAQFLESLRLVDCIAITDTGMRLLARSRCLMNLTLEWCDGLTDDGLAEYARERKLESLTIEKCSKISLKAVQGAAKTVHYTNDCPSFKKWYERWLFA
ncbi:hypothetical protein BS78_09G150200 [Paspalum vaginatum]|nr:hypothetical protein BS78_09G150200 [Paspalum vaginatum]